MTHFFEVITSLLFFYSEKQKKHETFSSIPLLPFPQICRVGDAFYGRHGVKPDGKLGPDVAPYWLKRSVDEFQRSFVWKSAAQSFLFTGHSARSCELQHLFLHNLIPRLPCPIGVCVYIRLRFAPYLSRRRMYVFMQLKHSSRHGAWCTNV